MKEKIKELGKDELVADWLDNVKDSSARQYLYRFYAFLEHFDLTPQQFLDEAKINKFKAKAQLNRWYKLLKKQGRTSNYAVFSVASVKSFLHYYEVPIQTNFKKPARKYKRAVIRKEHVKKMVNVAPHLRDKALIILAFQTGMSISDLVALNYKDVKDALKKSYGCIDYVREKEEIEAMATFGQDSITLLKQYIDWREEVEGKPEDDAPLFTGIKKFEGKLKRLTIRSAQNMMRKVVIKAGFIPFEELKKSKINIYGFHAIRKGFSSTAKAYGMPEIQVECSMGHAPEYNGAYDELNEKELLRGFQAVENELSIFSETKKIRNHDIKLDKQKSELDILRLENQRLKKKLTDYEKDQEERWVSIEDQIRELREKQKTIFEID